jgi:hypothetical protein
MGTLTLQFRGICTHFRYGVVAGVPHRVVLPDATRFATGFLNVHDQNPHDAVLYYLTPHFASLEVRSRDGLPAGVDLTVPPGAGDADSLIHQGSIMEAVRLQVLNATNTEMSYDGNVPSLTDFHPDYNISNDVVLGGRAACYFDLFGGKFAVTLSLPPSPPLVSIRIETSGAPVLLVTPLTPAPHLTRGATVKSYPLPLTNPGDAEDADVTLFVRNLETASEYHSGAEQKGGEYDYLLHYLTAQGGIPRVIKTRVPGLTDVASATPEQIGKALKTLGGLLPSTPAIARRSAATSAVRRPPTVEQFVTASCSDSQYP